MILIELVKANKSQFHWERKNNIKYKNILFFLNQSASEAQLVGTSWCHPRFKSPPPVIELKRRRS